MEGFDWTGDLDDDCSCRWNGLLLRAEWMDGNDWWWAVHNERGEVLDDSNRNDRRFLSGVEARAAAQSVALAFKPINAEQCGDDQSPSRSEVDE